MEDKLKKLQRFLAFWFSPWGAAKGERWEAFSGDAAFTPENAMNVVLLIIRGEDSKLKWDELPEVSDGN